MGGVILTPACLSITVSVPLALPFICASVRFPVSSVHLTLQRDREQALYPAWIQGCNARSRQSMLAGRATFPGRGESPSLSHTTPGTMRSGRLELPMLSHRHLPVEIVPSQSYRGTLISCVPSPKRGWRRPFLSCSSIQARSRNRA